MYVYFLKNDWDWAKIRHLFFVKKTTSTQRYNLWNKKYLWRWIVLWCKHLFWINEIKRGRKCLSNIPSTGRPLNDDVDYSISEQLKLNPYISARKIAKKAHCSISNVLNHLHHVFGLKNLHLKWVQQRLNSIQKELNVQLSKMLLKDLKQARKKKLQIYFN